MADDKHAMRTMLPLAWRPIVLQSIRVWESNLQLSSVRASHLRQEGKLSRDHTEVLHTALSDLRTGKADLER